MCGAGGGMPAGGTAADRRSAVRACQSGSRCAAFDVLCFIQYDHRSFTQVDQC